MSAHPIQAEAAAQLQANTLFASLELSKARWLVTVSAPGSDKLSRHQVPGGDGQALLELLWRLQAAAGRRTGAPVAIVVIQEAGLDGFWIHRLLVQNGITSHVVDAASIAVNRRHRRAKTDKIDGVKLLRTLMAWMRGERQVCSMVQPPSPENEDRRRLARERARLLKERVQHTNRIKGLNRAGFSGGSHSCEDGAMTKRTPPYSPEVRERAVRMVLDHQGKHGSRPFSRSRPRSAVNEPSADIA